MRFLFAANTPRDVNLGAPNIDIATIDALRSAGHEVDEIWGPELPRTISHQNLHQLFELPKTYAAAVERKCSQRNYDVIQVNHPHAYLAAKRHRTCRRAGIFLTRSHGWEPAVRKALAQYREASVDSRPWWRQKLSRIVAMLLERHNAAAVKWSDGIVLSSIDDLNYVINEYRVRHESLLSLAPGVTPTFFSSLPAKSESRWSKVLHIGNFSPQKAPDVVANVFRRIVQACPSVTVTWVCPAKFHAHARTLIGNQFEHAITLRDWMTRAELLRTYDDHGILIFPSYFEGFAQTFLEGMARGQCVLTTAIDGMRQTIRDGENGFTFQPGDAESIAAVALRLIGNAQECSRIGERARATALSFTWERTADTFVAFCASLLRYKCP